VDESQSILKIHGMKMPASSPPLGWDLITCLCLSTLLALSLGLLLAGAIKQVGIRSLPIGWGGAYSLRLYLMPWKIMRFGKFSQEISVTPSRDCGILRIIKFTLLKFGVNSCGQGHS
jgi:hypothetical protein